MKLMQHLERFAQDLDIADPKTTSRFDQLRVCMQVIVSFKISFEFFIYLFLYLVLSFY